MTSQNSNNFGWYLWVSLDIALSIFCYIIYLAKFNVKISFQVCITTLLAPYFKCFHILD